MWTKVLATLYEVKGVLTGILTRDPDQKNIRDLWYDVRDAINQMKDIAKQTPPSQQTATWECVLLKYRDEHTGLTLLDLWLWKVTSIERYRAVTGVSMDGAKDAVKILQSKWETYLSQTGDLDVVKEALQRITTQGPFKSGQLS